MRNSSGNSGESGYRNISSASHVPEMSEENFFTQESEHEDHRTQAQAIRAHHTRLLGRGFSQIMRIAKSAEKRAEKRTIVGEGLFYQRRRIRGLSKGFKSLRSNTDKQKQSIAVHYFEHRLRA